jgi:hypothetical protein
MISDRKYYWECLNHLDRICSLFCFRQKLCIFQCSILIRCDCWRIGSCLNRMNLFYLLFSSWIVGLIEYLLFHLDVTFSFLRFYWSNFDYFLNLRWLLFCCNLIYRLHLKLSFVMLKIFCVCHLNDYYYFQELNVRHSNFVHFNCHI